LLPQTLLLLPVLFLCACSTVIPVADPTATPAPEVSLYQWDIITGGSEGNVYTGLGEIRLMRPAAIAAHGDDVYIVDGGSDMLYRYERALGRLSVLKDLKGVVAGAVTDIFIAQDLSYYLADADARRVLHFDRHGDQIRVFEDPINLGRPVSVSEDPDTGTVYIADGFNDDVLVYNAAGQLQGAIGTRGQAQGQFMGITAMAQSSEGIYVATRFGTHRVQMMGLDGGFKQAFVSDSVTFPTAIVTDGNGRVYVSDFMDNTIRVYVDGQVVETLGGTGSAPGRFKRITDMWLDNGLLYVADSLNNRVQVIRVVINKR
jgi:DNA-binding beta-propeller fold protein YncE